MNSTFKRIYFGLLVVIVLLTLWVQFSFASDGSSRFFDIQSIDTMKYSRDTARNKDAMKEIPALVSAAASMHPTHIAIATPYDEEFVPVMKVWVTEIRKRNIKVWFRGNFSSWEGWFDYPKFKDPYEHIKKTEDFIKKHPELFEEGDIFTPAPEPENGGFGDPRKDDATKKKFFDFLPKSYDSCARAMNSIGKNVKCGYFSVNGDVAHLFTKSDVEKTGNVLVIDHYVKTPEQLVQDIKDYHAATGARIVLGEYGAPIPDIHGDLTEDQQNDLIKKNLMELVKIRDIMGGINYWTAFGGSTELFKDGLAPKKAVQTIEAYYNPIMISGHVEDEFGNALSGVTVSNGAGTATTNIVGNYSIMSTADFVRLTASKSGYSSAKATVYLKDGEQNYTKNFQITSEKHDLWYYLRRIFHGLTTFTYF